MSVFKILEDAITALMTAAADALHITIPHFSLPGLPDYGILAALHKALDRIFDILNNTYFQNVLIDLENLFPKFVFTFPTC